MDGCCINVTISHSYSNMCNGLVRFLSVRIRMSILFFSANFPCVQITRFIQKLSGTYQGKPSLYLQLSQVQKQREQYEKRESSDENHLINASPSHGHKQIMQSWTCRQMTRSALKHLPVDCCQGLIYNSSHYYFY